MFSICYDGGSVISLYKLTWKLRGEVPTSTWDGGGQKISKRRLYLKWMWKRIKIEKEGKREGTNLQAWEKNGFIGKKPTSILLDVKVFLLVWDQLESDCEETWSYTKRLRLSLEGKSSNILRAVTWKDFWLNKIYPWWQH